MSTADTLRMPEHVVPEPNEDAQDRFHAHKGILCRAGFEPGYAHMNPDGTLHCNRCGWVTPEPVVTAYNPDTDHTFLTWEELVEKESNGYVVVGVSERPGTVPMVLGPWPGTEAGKKEARNAQTRLRKKGRREEAPYQIRTYIRVLWPR